MRLSVLIVVASLVFSVVGVYGQSSSMMRLPAPERTQAAVTAHDDAGVEAGFSTVPPDDDVRATTRAIESVSLVATPRIPPRKFNVEDLVTIIVRQQKRYEADAKFDTEKKWDIDGKLSEWFRFYEDHRLGTDNLTNGEPGFQFTFNNKYETEGDNEREDKFETRIQAKVIDVKPNGNLVLEARQREKHDEEVIEITLTGTCRSEDVTAANTVFSTQIAELVLMEKNTGAVRDATQRGWVPRVLDFVRPF